jgi:hypothetical protein
MKRIICISIISSLALAASPGISPLSADPPLFVTLTWQGDTSTTMTVNYHTDENARTSEVLYDTESREGGSGDYAYRAGGTIHQIEGLSDRLVHVVELTGLEPGKPYYFVAGDSQNGYTTEGKFRTISNDGSPVRFVSGGDMGIGDRVDRLLVQAAAQAPDFAMIGGDIAYVNGKVGDSGKWDIWLRSWANLMVTPEGFMIPVALAVGNHEVRGGSLRGVWPGSPPPTQVFVSSPENARPWDSWRRTVPSPHRG